ncbi:MAG: hypothetical protein ACTSQY_11345 [Candidatus Odinarchaeia archaeon]
MCKRDVVKIASFSGGKDSIVMLLILLEKGEIPDYVVHFTIKESPVQQMK